MLQAWASFFPVLLDCHVGWDATIRCEQVDTLVPSTSYE